MVVDLLIYNQKVDDLQMHKLSHLIVKTQTITLNTLDHVKRRKKSIK